MKYETKDNPFVKDTTILRAPLETPRGSDLVNCGITDKKTPQIELSINRLEKAIVATSESVSMLHGCIEPILAPDTPVVGDMCAKEGNYVPLANKIRELTNRIEDINRLVRNLAGRVEL